VARQRACHGCRNCAQCIKIGFQGAYPVARAIQRRSPLRIYAIARRHAMNSGLMTDIGKEASVARSGSIDDETKPKSGQQFAPYGRRSPAWATSLRSQVCPEAGPPPPRDLRMAFVLLLSNERAIGLCGIWRAGRFHLHGRRVRPTRWRHASNVNPPPGWRRSAPAAQCDCNLHSSRAQFVEGANRVFDRQIDAS
jgi:hypothetical protein